MGEWEYCRLHTDDEGALHVSYFARNPAEVPGQRPSRVERLGWRRTPDPEADGTQAAMQHLEREGWLPAGDIPAGDSDASFQRYYQRLTS